MPAGPLLVMAGVDHHRASVDELARLVGQGRELPAIRARAAGVVAVSTCHRRELYLEGVPASSAAELLARWLGGEVGRFAVVRGGEEAVVHLLRVAAGLESVVLGEDQILGQLRAAYREACAGSLAGPLLHRLFHAAFRTGKRVRSETALATGGRSLAGSAVNFIEHALGSLERATVLVLGAGEMATIAANRLRERGAGRIVICSRTLARAGALAAAVGGEPLPWEWREQALGAAAAVIAAVSSPTPVIAARELRAAACGRRFVAVDLGLPRNLEFSLGLAPGVEFIDLDGLRAYLAKGEARRAGAVSAAEGIVAEEATTFAAWLVSRSAGDVQSPPCCRRGAIG